MSLVSCPLTKYAFIPLKINKNEYKKDDVLGLNFGLFSDGLLNVIGSFII